LPPDCIKLGEHFSSPGFSFCAVSTTVKVSRGGTPSIARTDKTKRYVWIRTDMGWPLPHSARLIARSFVGFDVCDLPQEKTMNRTLGIALAVAGVTIAAQAVAQITFYEHDGFHGRSFTTDRSIGNFERYGFNDRASSVVVARDQWEVCEDARFGGRCMVLRPGRYASLARMGLNDRISSVRAVDGSARFEDDRYAPAPVANGYQRRSEERLYEANVISVRAVVGPPEQRCWLERERVTQERGNANVPGAIAGALIGGILGHQIGGGHGQDLATAGGAVAGAAVGANVGRESGGQNSYSQDVQHCANEPSQARPDYWDVSYEFRGQEHRVQMTAPPGPTVTVNGQGEPRE
jgi:uncharacterized protein YcfJ